MGSHCQLVCKRQWCDHWTPLICNCIVISWQFHEESLTKSSKFSLKRGPVMSVPYLNSSLALYLVTHSSLTCLMWLSSLCRGETLVCDHNTQHSYWNYSLWYLNFCSMVDLLNNSAFNILMQRFLKSSQSSCTLFSFLRFPPFRGKGMVAFLCNMLILRGGTRYSEPGN